MYMYWSYFFLTANIATTEAYHKTIPYNVVIFICIRNLAKHIHRYCLTFLPSASPIPLNCSIRGEP